MASGQTGVTGSTSPVQVRRAISFKRISSAPTPQARAVPNNGDGVSLASPNSTLAGSNNTIGGTGNGAGNVISSNVLDGIFMSNAAGNFILGNVIAANGVGEDAAGINFESSDSNNIIAGNTIGTNAASDAMLGNSLYVNIRLTRGFES